MVPPTIDDMTIYGEYATSPHLCHCLKAMSHNGPEPNRTTQIDYLTCSFARLKIPPHFPSTPTCIQPAMPPKPKTPTLPKSRSVVGQDVGYDAAIAALNADDNCDEPVLAGNTFVQNAPAKNTGMDAPPVIVCPYFLFL